MKYNNVFKNKIGVIGLGYVGLPLAVEFSKKNLKFMVMIQISLKLKI